MTTTVCYNITTVIVITVSLERINLFILIFIISFLFIIFYVCNVRYLIYFDYIFLFYYVINDNKLFDLIKLKIIYCKTRGSLL